MILYSAELSEANQLAFKALNPDGKNRHAIFDTVSLAEESALTLLDLTANGQFQTLMAAKLLVERLIHMGFTNKINKIQLLISDVTTDKSTEVYAAELVDAFLDGGFEVTIEIPHVRGEYSLLVPPSEPDGPWAMYSMPESDFKAFERPVVPASELKASLESYPFYKECFTKKIYEGTLDAYLSRPECHISKHSLEGFSP